MPQKTETDIKDIKDLILGLDKIVNRLAKTDPRLLREVGDLAQF
jgi:hypothetical protein